MGIRWIGYEAVPLRVKTKAQLGVGHVPGSMPAPPIENELPANKKVVASTYEQHGRSQEHATRLPEKVIVAQQIMSSPAIYTAPQTSLISAWKTMEKHGFRHLPVVDDSAQLVGMLSDRDVLPFIHDIKKGHLEKSEVVANVMSLSLIIASLDTPVREIADSMVTEGVGCVPICDHLNKDRLMGVVSAVDILRGLVKHAPLEMWV